MAEYNQQFDTFQQWVNKASSWLTRRGSGISVICYDTKGRVCRIGGDFMRARDEGAFPVRWIWPEQAANLALRALEPLTDDQAKDRLRDLMGLDDQ